MEPTGFEDLSLTEVIEVFLYTSQNMFGEVVSNAERELFRRTPPPTWAIKFPLPTLAKEYHQKGAN